MKIRRPGLLLAVAGLLALAACSEGEDPATQPAPSATPALWSPCDGLDTRQVDRALGISSSEPSDGGGTAATCRFTPRTEGGPVLDANYLLFPDGLDAAWQTMGDFEGATVTEPDVAGADDARLVVTADADQLYVSGFVQNGELIQTVDVVDPQPYSRSEVSGGVRQVLAQLSEHAADSGVT